ncbi:cheB, two-component system, chemotaxis family, response regulator CheB (plasmid) [Nostoc flagelliforme CCNUN1]|uniref:protein-glutamate methylesterase n=1 Tax=Nostoc flagelliforme CCNUN1 TaxID=2038116 RepID=A0A2K8TBH4_9NOSO|nr:chemotaxis protein CheB [Nostoc flagelliforme]AUB44108.1 cheB, two-component system, chemotaxis family, response regulator CheB [Nostoc flagelliforme CCNUN1]AUB45001.1 cheB, two-component system, chemotaxis family, response regulator CheB [Nostoc flagelliforme CCNUN1]
MPGHDIIVIGTSAGGLKALGAIVGTLPTSIDAVVFIVQHLAADKPSILPKILADVSSLPASHPSDGEPIQKGRIYVAPPDHHLLVNLGSMRVVRGPQENRFRPAIDALFRSAARAYGSRVVGVVLTGYLDDGTVGLQAVKKRGGVAIVQDPKEAEYPSMATSALRYVKVDHCLPLAEIPDLLVQLSKQPAAQEETYPMTEEIEVESQIAEQQMNTQEFLKNVEAIGTRTTYTCPECNGSIWQIGKSEPVRFRCHIGHSFTANVFLSEQTQNIETALWSAVRAMEEKVTFSRQMSERMKNYNLESAAAKYEDHAKSLDAEVSLIRGIILKGFATKRTIAEAEEE